MTTTEEDPENRVRAQVTRRRQAVDPLLPAFGTPSPGCGAKLVVDGPDGQPAAVGTCDHWEGAAGSLELCWGTARRFTLTPWVTGPDLGASLDRLVGIWRDHLTEVPGTGADDTAAVITWPSRDIDAVATLFRRGFAPLAVVAVRPAPRHHPVATAGPSARIRRATPADLDTVAGLGLEVVRYDAHFGGAIERPWTVDALRREAADQLAGPDAWTWLAEVDGAPVGMLSAQRPESAQWIAPLVRAATVSYLELMAVLPGDRGRGIGRALVAHFHREIEAAGVDAALLHYAQLNPLSAPFWSRQGYRPLWTVWEARPAHAIR